MESAAQKASTGVAGLDDILGGGLPRNRLYLIQGDPGVGKTTLALQFLLAGRDSGESTLYVTLSETEAEVQEVASSHGWSLDGLHVLELTPADGLVGEGENTLFHPSEVELAESTRQLLAQIERWKPARVVLDSLSEMRLMAQTPLRYRRQILALKHYFTGRACTVLMLDDRTADTQDLQIQSLAHGVITMEQLAPLYGAERRRVRIQKLRAVKFRGGFHDFVIEKGGLVVFPRLVASEHHRPFAETPVSSGVPALDRVMGGGLAPGTSLLVLGPSGTGKSMLTTQLGLAAAREGRKALFLLFDESRKTFLRRGALFGPDLPRQVEAGQILLKQVDPAELCPGELAQTIRQGVERAGVRVVVIDGLNGYLQSMPEEQFLVLQLHELLTYLGQQGVVTLLVVAQAGAGSALQAPVDISYLADSVILMRHFETGGRVRRALSMLKKRSGPHEATIREVVFGADGITVGDAVTELPAGVLTGTAYAGDEGGVGSRNERCNA
jgi:circadian clock protein KaiC